jgi:hypothetical protein
MSNVCDSSSYLKERITDEGIVAHVSETVIVRL